MIAEKISSKRRANLRSKAQVINPIVMVGHEGITENVTIALSEALFCHELVKVKFQDYKEEVRVLSEELAEKTQSLLVAVTGFTAVFYKENPELKSKIK